MRAGITRRRLAIAAALLVVAAVIAGSLYHWRVTESPQNDDHAAARAVVNEYVDAINADDLSRLLNISVGSAQLDLETIDIQRNANDVGRWTESHTKKLRAFKNSYGDVKIVGFDIIAEGDKRVVAHVHTRFARQPEVMYLPGEDARFDLIEKAEGWRIESIGTYVAP